MPLSDLGFRRLAESVLDAILTIDEDSFIVYANPAVERIFGWKPDHLVGERLTAIMPPELRASHMAGLRRYVATGERRIPWSAIELPALHRDGRELRVEVTFTHLVTDDTNYFTGVIRDVTVRHEERRRVAAANAVSRVLADLPSSSETVLEVLEAVGEALEVEIGEFWSIDEAQDALVLSDSWIRPTAGSDLWRQESTGQSFAMGHGLPGRVWATREPAWIEDLTSVPTFPRATLAAKSGLRSGFAFPVLIDEEVAGIVEYFSNRRVPFDPELMRLLESIGHQIGQFLRRRRAEERVAALLESERRARDAAERARERAAFLAEAGALLDSSMSYEKTIGHVVALSVPLLADYAILYLVDGGRPRRVAFAHVDPAKERLVAELGSFPVRPDFFERVFGHGPGLLETIDARTLSDHTTDERHLTIVQKLAPRSGMFVPLAAHEELSGGLAFAYSDSGRRYEAADLELARELTARCALALANRRLYQEARDATLARDHLLAVVSHDLRNLLHGISLRTQALAIEEGATERERSAGVVLKTIGEMSELIDDLLDVSRVEAGALDLDREACNPETLLKRAAEILEPVAEGTHALEVCREGELPPVWADPSRIGRVLTNLLTNAIKYSPDGGRIRLTAEPHEEGVRFAVADDGPGIPEEVQEAIFNRFWRGDQRDREGIGLGLTIARSLIEAHGGRIWVESEPRAGATFYFTLPAAEVPSSAEGAVAGGNA